MSDGVEVTLVGTLFESLIALGDPVTNVVRCFVILVFCRAKVRGYLDGWPSRGEFETPSRRLDSLIR